MGHALRVVLGNIESTLDGTSDIESTKELFSYYMEFQGYSPISITTYSKGTAYLPYRNWKYGLVVDAYMDIERAGFSAKLILRRLETHIATVEEEILALQEKCEREKENVPAYEAIISRLTPKVEHVKRVNNTEFFLLDISEDNSGEELQTRINSIDCTIKPNVVLLSIDDVRDFMA